MSDQNLVNRRDFVKTAGGAVAATSLLGADAFAQAPAGRKRYAIIGTGERATGMWGSRSSERYPDVIEFVGLCDINPKRVENAKALMGVDCPTFTNFDEMLRQGEARRRDGDDAWTRSTASTSSRALDRGFDVMTEKPMVIDEKQCQAVLDAEKRNNKKIIVTFNYRYAPKHRTTKEILMSGEIGRVVSVDFAWYLDVYHGSDYFRRWHATRTAAAALGAQGHAPFRSRQLVAGRRSGGGRRQRPACRCTARTARSARTNCRACPHKQECRFYYDLTTNATRMKLYADCERRRQLLSRRVRVSRGHRHLRHDAGDREVLERRDDELLARRVHAVRGFPGGVQRREGTPRGARLRAPALGRARGDETEMYVTKSFGHRRKVPVAQRRGRPRRRRRFPARPDFPQDAGARTHAPARLARGRDVVPYRHRGAQEHRREESCEDFGARQAHLTSSPEYDDFSNSLIGQLDLETDADRPGRLGDRRRVAIRVGAAGRRRLHRDD